MAAGSDEEDAEWAGPIERDVRSLAGWDGEGEGEGTPLEEEEEEADGDHIPLTLEALYRDGDPERPDDAGADDGTRGADANDDATTCPVCFRPLRDLADTDAARLAHVNACLDDDGGWRETEEDDRPPVSSREFPPFAPSDTRNDDDDAIGATWDEGGEGEWHDVAAWLHAVDHGISRQSPSPIGRRSPRSRDAPTRVRSRRWATSATARDGARLSPRSTRDDEGPPRPRPRPHPRKVGTRRGDRVERLAPHPGSRGSRAGVCAREGRNGGPSTRTGARTAAAEAAQDRRRHGRRRRGCSINGGKEHGRRRAEPGRYVPPPSRRRRRRRGSASPARGSSSTVSRGTVSPTAVGGAGTGSSRTFTRTTTAGSPSPPRLRVASCGAAGPPLSCARRGWGSSATGFGPWTSVAPSSSTASGARSSTPITARAR